MKRDFPYPPSATSDRTVYSVSELNREVRLLLESGIGQVWVEGELSNLARPSSGHWYFSLKDGEAQVRCAMFRARNNLTRWAPREGQSVLARGRISLYEPRGDYQLLVEHLEDAGLGALQRAFEELKLKLAAEGLFAVERKRALPVAPRLIGVITSPTGAAIRDILHILARRFPSATVLIHPVPVQGVAAAPAIVAALELAYARAECDVLILARGGGSLEDLWAFNDERVARAIYRSNMPVVTGIGHEIDFTIADFVADVRAPTPSGAAELVTPDTSSWMLRLAQLADRFTAGVRRTLALERRRLAALEHRLQQVHPGLRLHQHSQRLDDLDTRLQRAFRTRIERQSVQLENLVRALQRLHPGARLLQYSQRLDELDTRLQRAVRARIERHAARLEGIVRALQTVSPLATLSRGFAVITRSVDGALVTSAQQLAVGETFDAQLAVGHLHAKVIEHRS